MKKGLAVSIISILVIISLILLALFFNSKSTLTQQINALNADITDKAEQIDALNADVADKAQQIDTLNADVADKAQQIDALNADIAGKAEQIDALNADVADKAEQIDALNADVAGKAEQIDALNTTIAEKDQQIDTLNADIAGKAEQIDALNADIAGKAEQIDALNDDIADKNQQIETLNTQQSPWTNAETYGENVWHQATEKYEFRVFGFIDNPFTVQINVRNRDKEADNNLYTATYTSDSLTETLNENGRVSITTDYKVGGIKELPSGFSFDFYINLFVDGEFSQESSVSLTLSDLP